jgi:hypothetical protein
MATKKLVQNHIRVVYQLEKDGQLGPNVCNFIQLPFSSYEKSVFNEVRHQGKGIVKNREGDVVQFCNMQVETAILLSITRDPATKEKTIKVAPDNEKPNIVFFREINQISSESLQLISELSILMWTLIKTKQLNGKQL